MNKRNAAKQRSFLAAYGETASVTKASEAAKIGRRDHYTWMRDDPQYPARFERAKTEAAGALESEAIRRAHEGVLEPVFYRGKPAGVIRVYSDGLMMMLLKGFMPEKYKERGAVEVAGPGGGPIVLTDARLSALSDDDLASLVEIARKLTPEAAS